MSKKDELVVRPARPDDARSIASILKELGWFSRFNDETLGDSEAQITRLLGRYVNKDGGDHVILVAENAGGEVIGYVALHFIPAMVLAGLDGYISDLVVREAERGMGVGRMLLEHIKVLAIERGCSRLMLLNLRNRESYKSGFYKKLGWTEREEAANFILSL